MGAFFHAILYQPIFNIFIAFYHFVPDVGVAILFMTLLVKLVLYPLTNASMKAQKAMMDLQPKLNEVKEKHKGNQQMLAAETMRLYKENKVSPFGSCLPIIIQLVISIALYYVLRDGLTSNNFSALYPFIPNPEKINTVSLGLFDLSQSGNVVLAVLAGIAQWWQAKMMIQKRPPKNAGTGAKDEDFTAIMNKQMLYMMPVLTVAIGYQLPSGLALYWLFSTVLTALQQLLLLKKKPSSTSDVIEGKIVD